MKEGPKSEGRGSKEGRNPNGEIRKKIDYANPQRGPIQEFDEESADFFVWGDEEETAPMALRDAEQGSQPPQDLTERTALFGEAIIRFAKKIPQNPVNNRLISQLVGAGTSVGANYCEADDAVSGKEFKLKIGISRKESKETMFFLRMIAAAEAELATEARQLWREAKELNLIFGSIWRK
jgi:four helix bundle protein